MSECYYCKKELPEAGTDSIVYVEGRFGRQAVCMSCLKVYKGKVVAIRKVTEVQ